MGEVRFSRAGDRGLFVDLGRVTLDELHAAASAVRRLSVARAWVVGHSSLLGAFDPATTSYQAVVAAVEDALRAPTPRAIEGAAHSITVSFAEADGPDLPLLLERARLTHSEFVDAIQGLTLRARFTGFLRGFAYLEGLPPSWQLPRRQTSRPRVPAGSFAVAGDMAGFYPADSPGGWNLVGRTAVPLWDARRTRPNLIAAGDRVRIAAAAAAASGSGPVPSPPLGPTRPVATVRAPGQLTLVVPARDEGRIECGLPPGGPFDQDAACAANGAVGNREFETVLECAGVGPTLELHERAVLSWFGGGAPIRVDGRAIPEPRLFEVPAHATVAVGPIGPGLRGVLALRGGIADPAGSFAPTPHALRAGDVIGRGSGTTADRTRLRSPERRDPQLLAALAGPHHADDRLLDWITASRWTVAPSSDRTGVRLHAPGGHPALPAELPSCGMQFGAVQCHPNGDLVVMGPDHPITGGYLQPLTAVSADLWKLGQLRAGDAVRFEVA